MISGAEATVQALEALDVPIVFTVPSAHNLAILKAIHQTSDIRVVGCRHEQAVVHAADGYARATGRLGVAIVSGGPGTANAMGGMYEAHHASSPVLLITSQVETSHLGRKRGYAHEADQQHDMLRTVSKDAHLVIRAADVAETLITAGLTARRGRPRPVSVEITLDAQTALAAEFDATSLVTALSREPASPDPAIVAAAAAVMAQAQRPLIWAGGGVIHANAADALLELARTWQAPVLMSREGRGSISDDDPLALGAIAITDEMKQFMSRCDVLLAVGSHFQQFQTDQWSLPWPARIVQLDVDPLMIGRSFTADVAVIADARKSLAALADALPELGDQQRSARDGHIADGQRARQATEEIYATRSGIDHVAISDAINDLRPADSVVVRDPTVPASIWGDSLMKIWQPRTSIRATSSSIGPALPTAVGAAVATGKPVIALHGDGGLMLSLGELATAVQAKAQVILIVFNDQGYQMLRNIEAGIGDGSLHDTELVTPRFAELAGTIGMPGVLVASAADFKVALKQALHEPGPSLIEVDQNALQPMGAKVSPQPTT